MPNMALIKELKDRYGENADLMYLGESGGMEKSMAEEAGVPFKGVMCGKLRRYFSWRNFLDVLKIPVGIAQAYAVVRRFKPCAVFCKGGYVSFPAAVAGRMAGVPVVLHESDVVPGLSNRLAARFASKICVSYDESKKHFPAGKVIVTGNPVRGDIACGDKEAARKMCGFKGDLPALLVTGGSQGAEFINNIVWDNLKELLSFYEVAHICGEGKMKPAEQIRTLLGLEYLSLEKRYKAFEFVKEEMKDLYALADVAVSRAGAMTLAEIAAVKIPAVLIPLGREASRGDQIDNATAFCRSHRAVILKEEDFDFRRLMESLHSLAEADVPFPGGEAGRNAGDGDLTADNGDEINRGAATDRIINLLESLC